MLESLTPCRLASAAAPSLSVSRSIRTIYSSVNRPCYIPLLLAQETIFSSFTWSEICRAGHPHQITRQSMSGITTSSESIALSKDLRKRGWSFVGPTTMYAFMQAMGLVNDHIEGCIAGAKVLQARADFSSPAAVSVR
jgi:DNA-3-methyladenine glycosylase I